MSKVFEHEAALFQIGLLIHLSGIAKAELRGYMVLGTSLWGVSNQEYLVLQPHLWALGMVVHIP